MKNHHHIILLLFFSILFLNDFLLCLRLSEVRIPNHTVRNSTARLECHYDMDGEALYSVKWYKDGHEFYRYVPRDMPPAQVFPLPGVHVDLHNSTDSIVVLKSVNLSSTGRYRCEVSAEAPSFQTVSDHGDMIVVVLPEQGPKITGGRPRYQIGDEVNVNCTSGRSKPATHLNWFINGESANSSLLKYYNILITGREGLETTILGLKFKVKPHSFRHGDMKLKCLATIATVYWKSNEESVEGDKPQRSQVIRSRESTYAGNSRADRVRVGNLDDYNEVMIAASEPLEFIPRGRQTAAEHPESSTFKKPVQFSTENLLLNRLKNVNLSSDSATNTEFWCIQDFTKADQTNQIQTTAQVDIALCSHDDEHELYVKGCVAVWTKGVFDAMPHRMPKTCFTCDSPIRYAFFCSRNFFICENPDKRESHKQNRLLYVEDDAKEHIDNFGICLIDSETLRVYSPCGTDFRTSFPFPVSNVFQSKFGLLLEKNASSAVVSTQSIEMPCFYSLSHPLNDVCPILLRTLNGHVSFITDASMKIAFTVFENDLVMLYDGKIGKHVLCKLRRATQEEKQKVGVIDEEVFSSELNLTNLDVHASNSIRFDGTGLSGRQRNSSIHNRTSNNNSLSLHASKLLNVTGRSKLGTSFDRSQMQSPYDRLELSSSGQTLFAEEEHKAGYAKPSKPIVPDLCVESIWIESIGTRDFQDIAVRGFLHVDLIGQKYICYLLKKTGVLMMCRLEKSNIPDTPIIGRSSSIPAKDALCVSALKLVIILSHCGSVVLYSGSVMVGKVDIGGIPMEIQTITQPKSQRISFPRRSSLLPTASASVESSFEDEVHLLSPVYPLQPQQYNIRNGNFCIGFKDVANNRVTLEYTNNLMYRISLPLLSECPLVTKCLIVLRNVLKKDIGMTIISKWYSVRNTKGSQDLSYEREWTTFQNYLLNSLGRTFTSSKLSNIPSTGSSRLSVDELKKRRKTDDSAGTDNDFKFLQAFLNRAGADSINTRKAGSSSAESKSKRRIDTNATLAPYIPIIFYSFHLLYEELKLDETLKMQRTLLSEFLNQLALDLKLDSYCLHYFLDNPDLVYMYGNECIVEIDVNTLHDKNCLKIKKPSIYDAINEMISKRETDIAPSLYPYIPNVNPISKRVIDLIALTATDGAVDGTYHFNSAKTREPPIAKIRNKLSEMEIRSKALQQVLAMNMSRKEISRFPPAIHYLLAEILERCRIDPPPVSDSRAFELILRPELYGNTIFDPDKETLTRRYSNFKNENSLTLRAQSAAETSANAVNDGMTYIGTKLMRLRFPKDLRIEEVRLLLASSSPVPIDIVQKVGVSDHDFIEEKEKQLLSISTRTMALPIGRGMVTLQSNTPASTENFDIPKLCLSGKEKEKGSIIEMQQIELPPNMNVWPLFHNGVAAGLQLTMDCKEIDSAWIVYNKPKTQTDGSTEHSGFLMALGLNDHLKILSSMSLYDYLVKCDEMTNLGIIIGMSAAYRGTMDTATTKLLSIHIEALLPPTALELDISQNVQIAAIMGIGLLYQGTAKRHIAEVLLQEIGRPPGPEMENCVERESYALTSGLALGLVTLGLGEGPPGLKDLQLPDILHYYMVGGNKRPLTGSQREKYKFQSFQVREGDTVNIDVTAPGATLALGLMFFRTNNKSVASWMNPPDTTYLLDFVRPDLLLLRIIARGLILWDDILPTQDWLDHQFPKSLKFDLYGGPYRDIDDDSEIDHEAICQAYCNIIAGGAFCIGLRYAGTQNEKANKTLDNTFKLFLNMNGMYVGEYAGKSTVECCLMLILLASSLVNAGSGDLNVLRRCRMLRNRIGPGYSHVTYGSHMAVHMALGFQFLGAGRFTISRSKEAIAALICALFPKFPTHSNDNRYHLQAFRHLYVLAVEPRIVLPRDIDTGKLCLCNVNYTTLDGLSVSKMAPCMLPELSELASVRFEDPNYWLIKFERGNNWNELERIIQKCRCIDIKQKAGCVSHIDDPTNLRSTFAHTLSTERYVCWRTHPLNLLAFTNDAKVQNFINKFLSSEDELGEDSKFLQLLMLQFYHCMTKDTMHALYMYIDLLISFSRILATPDYFDIWQLKLMQTIFKHKPSNILLSAEHLNAMIKRLETFMEKKLFTYAGYLQQLLYSTDISFLCKIEDKTILLIVAALIQFLDIPVNIINQIDVGEDQAQMDYMKLVTEMKKVNVNTDMTLIVTKILNAPGF